MPRKRSTVDEQSTTSAPTKRHRVSQACNPCRTAREKCDGTQPICGPCIEQNRACTYTSPSKKRGIPTGYIRTVELALAWLFEQMPGSEESLHRLLLQDGTSGQKIILGKEGKGADRLHKRWRKSKVHKEIERLLCNRDGTTPKTESSDVDSDTDEETVQSNATLSQSGMNAPLAIPFYRRPPKAVTDPNRKGPKVIRIPPNYHRLLDIYFSYTHCWLPILERDDITRTALGYPPEGLLLDFEDQQDTSHAQLWAVLALASVQDAASSSPPSDSQMFQPSHAYITSIAWSLIPADGQRFDLPHIRALLLMSLAAVGQDKVGMAWLLIGKATRLAMQLQSTRTSHLNNLDTPEARVMAGCFILDTLVALSLGQYPHCRVNPELLHNFSNPATFKSSETWASTPGFGSYQDSTRSSTQPAAVFLQLYKFSVLLSNHEEYGLGSEPQPKVTSEHLLRSLDPEFAYCNSLIVGGPIPMMPSSFVVQGIFLTATMMLMSSRRAASLVPNFIEVAESCITHFGACGAPPIILTCMSCLQRKGFLEDIHGHDKPRWDSIDTMIKTVWTKDFADDQSLHTGSHVYSPGAVLPHEQNSYSSIPTASNISGQLHGNYLAHHGSLGMHNPSEGFISVPLYQQQSLSPSATSPLSGSTSLKTASIGAVASAEHTQKGPLGQAGFMGQSLDYDAILEELGSIDCSDGLDMNSQFMANLGFAPGSDLTDMLHGDFGI